MAQQSLLKAMNKFTSGYVEPEDDLASWQKYEREANKCSSPLLFQEYFNYIRGIAEIVRDYLVVSVVKIDRISTGPWEWLHYHFIISHLRYPHCTCSDCQTLYLTMYNIRINRIADWGLKDSSSRWRFAFLWPNPNPHGDITEQALGPVPDFPPDRPRQPYECLVLDRVQSKWFRWLAI